MITKTPPKRPRNPLATPTVQSAPAEHIYAQGQAGCTDDLIDQPAQEQMEAERGDHQRIRPRVSVMPVRLIAKFDMFCRFRRRRRMLFLIDPSTSSARMIPATISRYRLYGGTPVAPAKLA